MYDDVISSKFDRFQGAENIRWMILAPDWIDWFGIATDDQVIDKTCAVQEDEIARIKNARPGDFVLVKECVFIRLGTCLDQV